MYSRVNTREINKTMETVIYSHTFLVWFIYYEITFLDINFFPVFNAKL